MKASHIIFFFLSFFSWESTEARGKPIIVSRDGSGDYSTVQAALDAVPLNNRETVTIFIKKGIYKEKLHLDSSKNFVVLVGEDRDSTILTYDDHSGKLSPEGDTINTFTSESFAMAADDFMAMHLTFQNSAGPTAGQAVAVSITGNRAIFLNCRLLGNQDTVYTGLPQGKALFYSCYIEGTTDFIFGPATVLFENCHIHSKRNSHVTAASTPMESRFGYVFRQCRLTADSSITKATLGRPWRPYASVTYLNCYIGSHIIPAGWDNWRNPANEKTARFSEYKSFGPGANPAARANWARQLTRQEAKKYTFKKIFPDWKRVKKLKTAKQWKS